MDSTEFIEELVEILQMMQRVNEDREIDDLIDDALILIQDNTTVMTIQ